eukprot:EG_transcript_46170
MFFINIYVHAQCNGSVHTQCNGSAAMVEWSMPFIVPFAHSSLWCPCYIRFLVQPAPLPRPNETETLLLGPVSDNLATWLNRSILQRSSSLSVACSAFPSPKVLSLP